MNCYACLPRTAAICVALALGLIRICAGDDLVNGSFESELSGWTSGGNISIKSSPPYSPTDGSNLAAFNALNSTPNGWIRQQVEIQNSSSRYHRLRFDVGNLGNASTEMRLRLEISEVGFGPTVPRINEVITIPGTSDGATLWQQASFDFRTPVTGRVEIKLTDVSIDGNNADLVVDHLRIDDSIQLRIDAANGTDFPVLPITVSPAAIEGGTNGNTPLTLNYHKGANVTITAPQVSELRQFLRWRKNGVDDDTHASTTITMDEDVSMVAIYDPPLILSLHDEPSARSFATTGPFSRLNWTGSLQNTTGAAEQWSAVETMSEGSSQPPFFRIEPSHGILQDQESVSFRIVLTAAAEDLPAGTHNGRVDIHSAFGVTSTGITLEVIDPEQHVRNPGFEQDFDCWVALNHVTRESQSPYAPSVGTHLVAFNSHNATPDGLIYQTIPTEAGVTYSLGFDVGVLSYNTSEQRLKVDISDPGDPAPPPFFSQTVSIRGIADGKCHWQRNNISFTANGEFTTITFKDVSTNTSAIDLLLDNVVVRNPHFNFMVTTLADENDPWISMGEGDSLRELIAEAARRPGTHNLYFHPDLEGGTITLGGTELQTTTPLAINSWTFPVTISGNGLSRIMNLGADTLLRNLQIMNGNTISATDNQGGGGILSQGDLTLSNVTVSDNSSPDLGGGVYSLGNLLASNSRISGNHAGASGGGLHNHGTSYLESCTIADNTAASSGGGLSCRGAFATSWIILERTSVYRNSTTGPGGAYSGLTGYKQYGNLHAINSTFSGNHSDGPGGAVYGNGPVVLRHSTLSANTSLDPQAGAGGVSSTWMEIEYSIVAGNTPDEPASPAILTDNNLIGGDPKLTMDLNGLMTPSYDSPAIDAAGKPADIPATDQRGLPRISGPAMDIGAVEIQQLTVNTLADEDDGITTGGISLRDAVGADTNMHFELIRFDPSLAGGTILLNGTPIMVHSPHDLSIDATTLPNGIVISGNDTSGVFNIFWSYVNVCGLGITGSSGTAIMVNDAYLKLIDSNVYGNSTTDDGAALALIGKFTSATDITRCNFMDNQAMGSGGAVSNGGLIWIKDSTFEGNQAGATGGAIQSGNYRSGLVIVNSTFSGNSSAGQGGAIEAGSAKLVHTTISGNSSASGSGGGIASIATSDIPDLAFTLANTIVAGNTAINDPNITGPIAATYGGCLTSGDPILAPLGYYGTAMKTMPPLPGSPVIEGAIVFGNDPPFDHPAYQLEANDQLGHTRPLGLFPDIGAVEAMAFSSLPLIDSDGDGMDDRIEPAYGMVVGTDDSDRDMDGDGSSDVQEIANMTDPGNANSLLRIVSITPAPGFHPVSNPEFDITFTSFPGMSYAAECDRHIDFHCPDSRSEELGVANDYTTTRRIVMGAVSDFARIRREP